jgi:hypothetical protein
MASPYEAASPTSTMRSSGEEPAQRPEALAFSIHRISAISTATGKRMIMNMITTRHGEDDLLAHEIGLAKEIPREGTSRRRDATDGAVCGRRDGCKTGLRVLNRVNRLRPFCKTHRNIERLGQTDAGTIFLCLFRQVRPLLGEFEQSILLGSVLR